MGEKRSAKSRDGTLYCIFRCFGNEFPVYYKYSDEDESSIPSYPDFLLKPRYTDDGRPFALVSQDCCELHTLQASEEDTAECGSCKYFYTEETFSLFGICMNDNKRLRAKKEKII